MEAFEFHLKEIQGTARVKKFYVEVESCCATSSPVTTDFTATFNNYCSPASRQFPFQKKIKLVRHLEPKHKEQSIDRVSIDRVFPLKSSGSISQFYPQSCKII